MLAPVNVSVPAPDEVCGTSVSVCKAEDWLMMPERVRLVAACGTAMTPPPPDSVMALFEDPVGPLYVRTAKSLRLNDPLPREAMSATWMLATGPSTIRLAVLPLPLRMNRPLPLMRNPWPDEPLASRTLLLSVAAVTPGTSVIGRGAAVSLANREVPPPVHVLIPPLTVMAAAALTKCRSNEVVPVRFTVPPFITRSFRK